MSDIINDYEIRVFAMQRSGHHAVMEWILGHFDGPVCFINDFSRLKNLAKQAVYRNINTVNINNDMAGKFIKKECLLINFEEESLKPALIKLSKNSYYPRGKSKEIINVLIMRDPYNLFASRLQMAKNADSNRERWIGDKAAKLWIQHAEEFLKIRSDLPGKTVFINYNKWFQDQEYRKELSQEFGLEFIDKTLLNVPKYGGGSSFDKMTKKGSATDMKVLDRWKRFEGNKMYKSFFDTHAGIIELSNKIFGKIKE